ncbi:MAG: sulfurtransferase TusA family protein [Oscillospiraceae bacterium]|nr:sulfurtransferase TusA family protein [Oscillospiraceae bacterium]
MIDVRGLLCPMPLVKVRKEIEKNAPASLEVLFDDKGALDNVTRFVTGLGYKTEVVKDGPDFKLVLTK